MLIKVSVLLKPLLFLYMLGQNYKRKRVVYFTKETQDAIIRYNQSESYVTKNAIYEKFIHNVFDKLVENIVHKFKFYYTDVDSMRQLKHEVIIHLYNNLHLYNPAMGKAYSYFGTAAKRFLIQYNEKNHKRLIQKSEPAEVDALDLSYSKYELNEYEKHEESTDYFTDLFIDYLEKNDRYLFKGKPERQVVDSFISILKERKKVEIFDRRSLNVYIKSITEVSQPKINEVFLSLKKLYLLLNERYEQTGTID